MVVVRKFIREYMPFIMLGYSSVFAVLSYFQFYKIWFNYLPQFLGFSLITNIFMYSVYCSKKYCTSTKIAVYGLMICNIVAFICKYFEINKEKYGFVLDNALYDIVLIVIIYLVLVVLKLKRIPLVNEVFRRINTNKHS